MPRDLCIRRAWVISVARPSLCRVEVDDRSTGLSNRIQSRVEALRGWFMAAGSKHPQQLFKPLNNTRIPSPTGLTKHSLLLGLVKSHS